MKRYRPSTFLRHYTPGTCINTSVPTANLLPSTSSSPSSSTSTVSPSTPKFVQNKDLLQKRIKKWSHIIENALHSNDNKNDIKQLLDIHTQMTKHGLTLPPKTYDQLLEFLANHSYYNRCLATIKSMQQLGIKPTARHWELLLLAAVLRNDNDTVDSTWAQIYSSGIKPTLTMYYYLLEHCFNVGSLESSFLYFDHMNESSGLTPDHGTMSRIIQTACKTGQARIALELAKAFERGIVGIPEITKFSLQNTKKNMVNKVDAGMSDVNPAYLLNVNLWITILRACADDLYMDGIEVAWDRLEPVNGLRLDENLSTSILVACGRTGNVDIALKVIDALASSRYKLKEYHFAPLIEAFTRCAKFLEAIDAIGLMREYNVKPCMPSSTLPLSKFLSQNPQHVQTIIGFLDECSKNISNQDHQDSERKDHDYDYVTVVNPNTGNNLIIDLCVINAIMVACVRLKDEKSLEKIYSIGKNKLLLKPNLETINNLLWSAIFSKDKNLGQSIWKNEFGDNKNNNSISPDRQSYSLMVRLYSTLQSQSQQESQQDIIEAFKWVSKTKKRFNVCPTKSHYMSLLKRLTIENDHEKCQVVIKDMQNYGIRATDSEYASILKLQRKKANDQYISSELE